MLAMHRESFEAAFPDPLISRLHQLAELGAVEPYTELGGPAARAQLPGIEVLITGWGCPRLDAAVLESMPSLRAVVHTAGSVKPFLDPAVIDRGIAVSSAAYANAIPVAEYTFAVIVLARKRAFQIAHRYRTERRRPALLGPAGLGTAGLGPAGLGTRGVVIGVVGASRIGRRVIALLGALDATILLADPYVPPEQAAALGVELVTLDELLAASDVVTLHAPATPRTRRLLDRRRLRLLRDGATLVNTARGSLIDEAALVEELVTGRIDAVLDVTDPEPPRPDSPLYELPNVFLTPHLAGALGNEIPRLTESALDELARYAAGEPFAYPVRAEEFDHIA